MSATLEGNRSAILVEPKFGSPENPYYSADELRAFSDAMMPENGDGILTEGTFEEDLASAGGVDVGKVAATMERAYDAKTIIGMAIQRIALGKGVAHVDDADNFHHLRVEDNRHSRTLAKGSELLFNLAASELFFAAQNHFPEGVSESCRNFCMDQMRTTVMYEGRVAVFDPVTDELREENGSLYERTPKKAFEELYEESLAEIQEDGYSAITNEDDGLQIQATYLAFRKHFEALKDEVALLEGFILPEAEIVPARENWFSRIINKKVPIGEIDFERLFARQELATNIIDEFGDDTKHGIRLLETNLGKKLGLHLEDWQKTVRLSRSERLRNEYVGLKQGPLAKRIAKVAFSNAVYLVGAVGLVQVASKYQTDVSHFVKGEPYATPYKVFTSPEWKVLAVLAVSGFMNIIPDALFERMLTGVQNDHYGQSQIKAGED